MSNFNSKYKTKINFNIILQSDKEELKIIEKVSNYLLKIFLDYYSEENKNTNEKLNNKNNELGQNKEQNKEDRDSELENNRGNEDESNDEDNDIIKFEFFPKKRKG